ncbi:MAG: cell division protein FtsZ [Patescibacteria group bacterium]
MPEIKPEIETFAKIKVVGIGGSGCSAINRMIASKIKGVEFIAINTDVQALHHNDAKIKLHIGQATTKGLGAGMNPEIGFQSAQENINDIRDLLKNADMVFITCGMGGGTGTGAAPIIAAVAKELGALVVAVVTKPFSFEGAQRAEIAERGHRELCDRVDTIITIPNDKILQIIDKKTSLLDAFTVVDDVLRQGVQGISELITIPGLINVDFADVKSIMKDSGSALMGIGEMGGDNRAVAAAKKAISSPLLDVSIDGAKGILFTITGGLGLTMDEVNEAANVITESADDNARIIFGAVIDEGLKDKVRITVVATGFGGQEAGAKASFEEPKYSMNRLFSKKIIEDKMADGKGPNFNRYPSEVSDREPFRPAMMPQSAKPRQTAEEEDLEIPAFIRKKMK